MGEPHPNLDSENTENATDRRITNAMSCPRYLSRPVAVKTTHDYTPAISDKGCMPYSIVPQRSHRLQGDP